MENHRPSSDRWKGTLTLLMETEDASDTPVYDGGYLSGGDNITSTRYRPKFILSLLSLNDTKSKWQYYFEGYYQNNSMFQGKKGNEVQDFHATRIHGEAKWVDSYSKGRYGFTVGYRNETAEKEVGAAFENHKGTPQRYRIQKTGFHQLRLAPNATYNLGHGFMLTGRVNGIFQYNYTGDRESEMDFLTETDIGLVYDGFMPRWKISATYHRDDKWYDDDAFTKIAWSDKDKEYVEENNLPTHPKRWHLAQFRPSIIYYFGNNSSFKFDMRLPLGNGSWTNFRNGKKSAGEDYEVRYNFLYSQQVASGLTLNLGATFVPTKSKNTKTGIRNGKKSAGEDYEVRYNFLYSQQVASGLTLNLGATFVPTKSKNTKTGNITRNHSFRPNIGFSYSF